MTETANFNIFRSSPEVRTCEAGETVFSAGDAGDCMFAVQDGRVDLIVGDDVVETVAAGGIFGEMALIEHGPRSATAVARTATTLAIVDERQFKFMTQNTPNFALNVMRVMARRLREMDSR